MKEKHTNSRNLLFRHTSHTIDVRFNWTKSCFYAPGSEDYIELRKETDCVCSMSLTIMQCTIYSTPPIFPPTAFWQQINFNSPAFHCVCAYLWRQSKKVQSGRKTFPYIWRTVNNKKKATIAACRVHATHKNIALFFPLCISGIAFPSSFLTNTFSLCVCFVSNLVTAQNTPAHLPGSF